MVGGPESAFNRVKPLFELMGKNITLVGGNGDGQTTKVANQIIVALTIEAVAEACCSPRRPAPIRQVRQALMGGFASSRILEVHGERMIKAHLRPGLPHRAPPEGSQPRVASARVLGISRAQHATAQELFNACAAHGGRLGPFGHAARAGDHGQPRDRIRLKAGSKQTQGRL